MYVGAAAFTSNEIMAAENLALFPELHLFLGAFMSHSLKQQDRYLFKIFVNSGYFIFSAPGKEGI